MSSPLSENYLAERHYATLVLRLLLDRRGRLVHGELLDVANARPEHFIDARGLVQAVQTWLTRQEQVNDDDDWPARPST